MTAFMIIIVIALFMVLLGFTWYRLEAYEQMEKVIICVAGILLSWGITTILFSLSSGGMNYISEEIEREISKILVLVFTPINGIAFMPYVAKIMSKVRFDEMNKQEATKKIFKWCIILIAVFFVEVKYLENIQLGILDVANKM